MMRNAWHISGGDGWCANTSNRRVHVLFADGHQGIEEVPNDMQVGNDPAKIKAAREGKFGAGSVKAVSLTGAFEGVEEAAGTLTARGAGGGPARASTSGGARTRGAGLGLRFVKVVTERHGGTINVESTPDEGSCFRLTLPRIDVGGL